MTLNDLLVVVKPVSYTVELSMSRCRKLELLEAPWETVGSDVLNGKLYVVVIDYYTHRIEAIEIARQTAAAVVTVMKEIFARLGIPKSVKSEMGVLKIVKNFYNLLKSMVSN
jgi:hypothetical protein